jgi:hypothetical protein
MVDRIAPYTASMLPEMWIVIEGIGMRRLYFSGAYDPEEC